MKKVILALVCLLLINSCGFEIPKSITIKGEPGLYVPLGSSLDIPADLNPQMIKEKIESGVSGSDGIKVYEVSNDMVVNTLGNDYDNVLTYLVEYQLADMPLNLQTYMNKATDALNNKGEEIRIPDIPSEYADRVSSEAPLYVTEGGSLAKDEVEAGPFLRIPLNDMKKLVKEVTKQADGQFGLKISKNDNILALKENLRLKIPALGIDYDTEGKLDPATNDLLFVGENDEPFVPREQLEENGDLLIYARISGACEGTIVLEIVFDWETAKIDTEAAGNSAFKEEYHIKSLNFPIGEVSLKHVLGYVYMSGIESNNEPITMTVGIANKEDQVRYLQDAQLPLLPTKPDGTVDGILTTSSFDNSISDSTDAPLELASVFETEGGVLNVDISISSWEIQYDQADINKSIKCRLFVLIPLVLDVSAPSAPEKQLPYITLNGENIRQTYVPLDLGSSLLNMDSDLFGRSNQDDDDIISSITNFTITLKDFEITITDPKNLAILIERGNADPSKPGDYKLLPFTKDASLSLDKNSGSMDFINKPFIPKLTVLLKKDTPSTGDSGSFRILRPVAPDKPAKFDFKLGVTAKTALEYKIKL